MTDAAALADVLLAPYGASAEKLPQRPDCRVWLVSAEGTDPFVAENEDAIYRYLRDLHGGELIASYRNTLGDQIDIDWQDECFEYMPWRAQKVEMVR